MKRGKSATILEQAVDQAGQAIGQVKDQASELTERLAPVVEDAKVKLGEAATAAAVKAEPMVTKMADAISEKTPDNVTEKVNAMLPTKTEEKKGGKLKKFLLALGLGAVVAAVAKKMQDKKAAQTWHSAPSTPPTPTAAAAGAASAAAASAAEHADDSAGASPDEAKADETEAPHRATTPDNPVTEIDIEKK